MWVFFFERRLFSVVLGDIFMVPGNGDSVIIFNVTEMVLWLLPDVYGGVRFVLA